MKTRSSNDSINKNNNCRQQINFLSFILIFNQETIGAMSLSSSDKNFYNKLKFLASVEANSYNSQQLTQDDLFEVCQYVEPYMIQKDKSKLIDKIKKYKDQRSGDTCLHIAGKASNKKLVKFLIEENVINPNSLNNRKQTTLTSVLNSNEDAKSDQIAYFLAKHTDITLRDLNQKRAFEVSQARMDPSRARLLEHLKSLAAGR